MPKPDLQLVLGPMVRPLCHRGSGGFESLGKIPFNRLSDNYPFGTLSPSRGGEENVFGGCRTASHPPFSKRNVPGSGLTPQERLVVVFLITGRTPKGKDAPADRPSVAVLLTRDITASALLPDHSHQIKLPRRACYPPSEAAPTRACPREIQPSLLGTSSCV